MERVKIDATKREKKENLTILRGAGNIPAVLYGSDRTPVSIIVNTKKVEDLHSTHGGFNFMVDLSIDKEKEILSMICDSQSDPVKRNFLHVDFREVNLKVAISVDVPIHFEGEAIGVKEGGVMDIKRRSLEVKCLPTAVPQQIEIDVSGLNIHDNVHIDDITLPEGVECPHDANFTIVSVVPPTKEEEVVADTEAVPAGEVPTAADTEAAAGEGEGELKDGEKS